MYLAQEPNLSIQVAIKVFDSQVEVDKHFYAEPQQEQKHETKKTRTDFIGESKILHQLSSAPHIVPFMEFDFSNANQPFIVMPYYKRSLADILGTQNKLSTRQTLLIAEQILTGLTSIHEAGLIHLDIKPANILLDDNDQVLIADFGISIAKAAPVCEASNDSILKNINTMGIGSPYYASPEQLADAKNVTAQSDIYAVSALMYRCISAEQFSEKQQPLNTLNPTVDDEVSRLIDLGLSTRPEQRPESAKHMNDSIAKIRKRFDDETNGKVQNHDPEATRIWVNRAASNNNMSALKESIKHTLLKEGEIDQFHFARLELSAKAELHEMYSSQWLSQYIEQTQSQLGRENANAAAFILWVEQVNAAINTATQKIGISGKMAGLSEQSRRNLIELGSATLNLQIQELSNIIERKLLAKVNKCIEQKSVGSGNKSKSGGRFVFAVFIVACAFLIPWWLQSDNMVKSRANSEIVISNKGDEQLTANHFLTDVNNTRFVSDANVGTELSEIQIHNNSELGISAGKIQVILQVQPIDATVVLQSMQGIPVSNENVQQGEYWLRVSKNGYKTVSKKINIDVTPFIINEWLELSDTRYFIGNTDKTVADGIPVEFILLPTETVDVATQNTNIEHPRIRMMSFEVTNQLYGACVNDGQCATSKKLSTDPRYRTFSLPEHPVVNVSWYDVTEQFIPWLSSQTHSKLRLPTKQEWELAAAGTADGSVKTESGGARMQTNSAHCRNCGGTYRDSVRTTMPVRSFSANNWQLYDMHGNAQEWTSTCLQPRSTLSSQANLAPRCDLAIVKGGSWMSDKADLTISIDDFLKKTVRSHTTGFRLVEEVNE